MKTVRPGRFVSLVFGVLSVLALAALASLWPRILAQDRVPPLFFAAIMAGIAFSAFWHLHNLFARRPFALYEIHREKTARGTVRRVRPGKSMAVLCGSIFALMFIFGGYWMYRVVSSGERLFALFGLGFFAFLIAACVQVMRTCVGKKRAALYEIEDEGPSWEEEPVLRRVRPARPFLALGAAGSLLCAAFDAVWLYLAVVSGAPWYFPAAGVCMLGAMLFAAVQNIRYARRKRPPVIAETVQAKKRKHGAKH